MNPEDARGTEPEANINRWEARECGNASLSQILLGGGRLYVDRISSDLTEASSKFTYFGQALAKQLHV